MAGAAALLSGCQVFYPAPPEATNESIRAVLYDAATVSGETQNYYAAIAYYRALYVRDPSDARSIVGLAGNLRRVGKTADAVRLLQHAVVRLPDRPELLAELGKAQLAAGRPEEASVALRLAVANGSDDWRTYSAAGVAMDMLGEFQLAQESYGKALALSPGRTSVLNNMALSWALAGKIRSGIGILERISLRPAAGAQTRQNLALLYAMNGEADRAAQVARRDLSPKDLRHNLRIYSQIAADRPLAEN